MKYIVHTRFKGKAICGEVNLPALTECDALFGMISKDYQPLCLTTSENAHNYFARNDDGRGVERGQLIKDIKKLLAPKDDQSDQERWNKIWEDEFCQKFKKSDNSDWIWNQDFYEAEIEDLQYIYNLISK